MFKFLAKWCGLTAMAVMLVLSYPANSDDTDAASGESQQKSKPKAPEKHDEAPEKHDEADARHDEAESTSKAKKASSPPKVYAEPDKETVRPDINKTLLRKTLVNADIKKGVVLKKASKKEKEGAAGADDDGAKEPVKKYSKLAVVDFQVIRDDIENSKWHAALTKVDELIEFCLPETQASAEVLRSVLLVAQGGHGKVTKEIIELLDKCEEEYKAFIANYTFRNEASCKTAAEASLAIYNETPAEANAYIEKMLKYTGTDPAGSKQDEMNVWQLILEREKKYCNDYQFFYSVQTTEFALVYDMYSRMRTLFNSSHNTMSRRENIVNPNIVIKLQNIVQFNSYFRGEYWKSKLDRSDLLRMMLLSASYSLFNDADWEGALYFYRNNVNASPWITKKVMFEFLEVLDVPNERLEEYYSLINKTSKSLQSLSKNGIMMHMAVKQNMVDKLAYLSRPYGIPFNNENLPGADIHTEKKGVFKSKPYTFNEFLRHYRKNEIKPQDIEDLGGVIVGDPDKVSDLAKTERNNKAQARLLVTAKDFYNPAYVKTKIIYPTAYNDELKKFYKELAVMFEADMLKLMNKADDEMDGAANENEKSNKAVRVLGKTSLAKLKTLVKKGEADDDNEKSAKKPKKSDAGKAAAVPHVEAKAASSASAASAPAD